MHSLEYSFATTGKWEKVDLFFIYQNQTHYLLPFHVMPQFAYSIYPKYYLCSAELLGYKLLVPCDPEKIIITGKWPLTVCVLSADLPPPQNTALTGANR